MDGVSKMEDIITSQPQTQPLGYMVQWFNRALKMFTDLDIFPHCGSQRQIIFATAPVSHKVGPKKQLGRGP